jgi:biopolymer transport protein ExbB
MGELLRFIQGGGVMMYPLLLCSIILVSLSVERIIMLRKASIDGDEILEAIKSAYCQDPGSARALCETYKAPLGAVFARGIRNAHRDADAIEMAMEQEAASELPGLEANLPVIKTIINIAPLLGLLGTIAGMITSFRAASAKGLSSPNEILGGISEALISTATGITLAVVGFVLYNYFANQAKKITEDIEYYGAELVNFLSGRID